MKHILIENGVFWEDDEEKTNSAKAAEKYFKVSTCSNSLFYEGKEKPDFWRGSFGLKARLRRLHGIIEDDVKFNCLEWLPALKKFALNNKYFFLDAETLLKGSEEFFPVFIRPVKGFKEFSGQVFTKEKFTNEFNHLVQKNYSPHTICQISPVQKVEKEYRFIVIDGKIVDGCLYLELDERKDGPYVQEAWGLAEEVIKNDFFANFPNFVIDICESNGIFKLLEINSIHTSSFYSCNLDLIYEKLANYYL